MGDRNIILTHYNNVCQVSSSCDGTIRVWQLKDFSEMVSWNCVPKSNSWQHATALGQTAWLPETGELLAVPGQGRVTIYRRQTWETKQTAMVSNQDSLVSIHCLSCLTSYTH